MSYENLFPIGTKVYHIWGWDNPELLGPYTIASIASKCPCCDAAPGPYYVFEERKPGSGSFSKKPWDWSAESCFLTPEEAILEHFESLQKGRVIRLKWEALPQEEKDRITAEREVARQKRLAEMPPRARRAIERVRQGAKDALDTRRQRETIEGLRAGEE